MPSGSLHQCRTGPWLHRQPPTKEAFCQKGQPDRKLRASLAESFTGCVVREKAFKANVSPETSEAFFQKCVVTCGTLSKGVGFFFFVFDVWLNVIKSLFCETQPQTCAAQNRKCFLLEVLVDFLQIFHLHYIITY